MLRSVGADHAELVNAWMRGAPGADERIVQHHYAGVRRFFDLRCAHAADDLTQQTFLACLEVLNRVEKAASFRAFLFGVARHVLLRHLRAEGRKLPVESYTTRPGEPGMTATGVIAKREEQVMLLRAMESIPMDQRIVIEMHYWEALDSREISEVLRVPQSTVTTRLSRARTRLMKHVEALQAREQSASQGEVESWLRSLSPQA